MRISQVEIVNFRSIDSLKLDFKHPCQALIGINESGKSNILKALQLLDPVVPVLPTDLRMERKNESEVSSGYVRFSFELEEIEIRQIETAALELFDPTSLNQTFAIRGEETLTPVEFCARHWRGLHEIGLPEGKRKTTYWALPKDEYKIAPGWARNTAIEAQVLKLDPDLRTVTVAPNGFVNVGNTPLATGYVPVIPDLLNDIVGKLVVKFIGENLPKCIFWKYSDQYLLPSSINITTFAADPSICVPLRSMFELANYALNEIGPSLVKARAHSQHRYIQLLRKVELAASNHIRDVWKDHKQIRVELQPNGELLVPIIIDDSVPLDMASRSDGFKRFVSFLLQVSAKVRSNELTGVLLLVDEPEIGLHPGGAKSLMKELIKIGATNTVVYSTHSIFMVDQETVDRHLIVEKKSEVTRVTRAEKSRIQDEQVLYAAMGYSIFEALRHKNVIFEGWRDKELFRIVAEAMSKADKEIRDTLVSIGLTYAEGVKDIKNVVNFLELASRPCLIVSDADAPALEKRKQYSKIGAWGKWVTLKEIVGDHATTGEDLILRSALIKRGNKWRSTVPGLSPLSEATFASSQGAMNAIATWLGSSNLSGTDLEAAKQNCKNAIYDGLKRDEISDDAEKLVRFVLDYDFGTARANSEAD